jgi:DNA-binding MltR family transcriptional regulator
MRLQSSEVTTLHYKIDFIVPIVCRPQMAVTVKEFQDELNRVNRVLREFFKENDRAAAVLVAAEIDRVILKMLESFMLPARKASSPFLGRDAPLEAFAVRIELLYRIGLIPPVMHHDLQLIRKIRNKFAHGPTGLDFDQSPVKELATKLVAGRHEEEKMLSLSKKPPGTKSFAPRDLFRLTASLLLCHLCLLQYQISRCSRFGRDFSKLRILFKSRPLVSRLLRRSCHRCCLEF